MRKLVNKDSNSVRNVFSVRGQKILQKMASYVRRFLTVLRVNIHTLSIMDQ